MDEILMDVKCANCNYDTKLPIDNIVCTYRKVLYVWILFFGSNEEARNYSCRISIKNKLGNEFNYSGPVHTLDKTEKAIVNSGFLLSIGLDAAKKLANTRNSLKIMVTIQNRKSEAISTELQDFYQPDSDSSIEPEEFYSYSDIE